MCAQLSAVVGVVTTIQIKQQPIPLTDSLLAYTSYRPHHISGLSLVATIILNLGVSLSTSKETQGMGNWFTYIMSKRSEILLMFLNSLT